MDIFDDNFIRKVFNYYNGKINVFNNTAVLDINHAQLNGTFTAGYSRLPDVVSIHPEVIYRFNNGNDYNSRITAIETIIHELFHTDQVINYNRYVADATYNKYIEHACEMQTSIYLLNHLTELEQVFGIENIVKKEDGDKVLEYWYLPGLYYKRRDLASHIHMCINGMSTLGDSSEDIYTILDGVLRCGESWSISIIVNGEEVFKYDCDARYCTALIDFNNSMRKYRCTGYYECSTNVSVNYDKSLLTLYISMDAKNTMCIMAPK